ncbi:MAG: tetraacyldisaccharide 4'-kinase [Bacteroidetes bacterium]|nr:MAG: tetraacyldisaccharide 4'-kinase [Bacteroidota bacterium]
MKVRKLLLLPLSCLYRGIVWLRNWLYDIGVLKSEAFSIPSICIGNISVGGTGKTPHTEYLAALLMPHYRVATLSRGYKRKTKGFRLVSESDSALEAGDEPLQIKLRHPGLTVAVDERRVNGIRELMRLDPPLEVVLLDDAFQHRSLKAGYYILLMDYSRPNDRDLLLPAGRLREPARNRERAHLILVTRSPKELKPIEMREYVKNMKLSIGQHLFFTTLSYGPFLPVFSNEGAGEIDEEAFRKRADGILLVTGIAHPQGLQEYAKSISKNTKSIVFRDHHQFKTRDVRRIEAAFQTMADGGKEILILTTEKDAARLKSRRFNAKLASVMFAVRIHVRFLNNDRENFDQQILSYVNSNKRSSILHQESDQ